MGILSFVAEKHFPECVVTAGSADSSGEEFAVGAVGALGGGVAGGASSLV